MSNPRRASRSPLDPLAWLAALAVAVTCAACGAASGVDQTTASFEGTLDQACASGHDCAANQRCVSQRCELSVNACVRHDQCGSARCEAGFCALPSPALLYDAETTTKPKPSDYLRVGNDGLVDGRSGLVLGIGNTLGQQGDRLTWHDFTLRDWVARAPARSTWAPAHAPSDAAPERFVLENPDNGAQLVAYLRPLEPLDHRATLAVHAARLATTLERGHPLAEAVTLSQDTIEALPLEQQSLEAVTFGSQSIEAIKLEAQRRLTTGSDRLRVYVSRLRFGSTEYVAYVGLDAPFDVYADSLDELAELVEATRFGGIDSRVGSGL